MPDFVDVARLLLTSAPIGLAVTHFYLRLVKLEIAEASDGPADWFRFVDRAASLAAWVVSSFCVFKGLDAWFWWLPASDYKLAGVILSSMFESLFLLLGISRLAARPRRQACHHFLMNSSTRTTD